MLALRYSYIHPARLLIAASVLVVGSGIALTVQAQKADRIEDRLDRIEDRRDRAVNHGPRDRMEDRWDRRENRVDRRTGPYHPAVRWAPPRRTRVVVRPPNVVVRPGIVAPRVRIIRGIHVHRPFGPTIYGYGFFYLDNDALPWLAFTAITLKLLDNMNEEQLRYHEQAQIEATKAEVGESITWDKDGASGSVTTLRQGTDATGHQCREFHHSVSIGGEAEDAYGVACLQDDGSWKIVQ